MAGMQHHYSVNIEWVGNRGSGTSAYTAYSRDHVIQAPNKAEIAASSDPKFRGDAKRWNPEELLVASLSTCHQLWYLHLCSENGITVLAYTDQAEGTMVEDENGGHFTRVLLHPHVTIPQGQDTNLALSLHHQAHQKCFIANSVNFPVEHEPVISH